MAFNNKRNNMLFNSFDRKLKKMYAGLNPALKDQVFPKGEKEFVYVGNMLSMKFPGKDIIRLIQSYTSVYSYYNNIELANAAKTYAYAKKKCLGLLTDKETLTFLAIVALNTAARKIKIDDPFTQLEQFELFMKDYIERVAVIQKHPDMFRTQKHDAGDRHNPILVDGVKGIYDYINCLNFDSYTFGLTSIKYEKTSTVYLTNTAIKLDYAIDEYTIKLAANDQVIAKLWFNIYGTENSFRNPTSLKFKEGSSLAIKQQRALEEEALAEAAKKEAEKRNAVPGGKTILNTDDFADLLVKKSLKAVSDMMVTLAPKGIPYDPQRLFIATTAYCFTIWMVVFANITLGQARKIEEQFRKSIIQHFKTQYQSDYPIEIQNEESFKKYLWNTNLTIRVPYEEHNMVLADYGISDKYIEEFIVQVEHRPLLKKDVASLLFDNWVSDAGQLASTTHIV